MGAAILSELLTEVLIPVAAVVGIVFALVQWVIVSKVKVTPGAGQSGGNGKNGYTEYLIEEEEGLNDHNIVEKCAEIQNAISEGPLRLPRDALFLPRTCYVGLFQINLGFPSVGHCLMCRI